MSLYWLGNGPGTDFPPPWQALDEPNGLLAAGGDLSETRLLAAYQRGIFPWYNDGQPVLWWSPDPRMVLVPEDFHASRSLLKAARKLPWRFSYNTCFDAVVDACASPRADQDGTWITDEMRNAYRHLHAQGWAHSIEVWLEGGLVGGLYGVAIDRVFFGESMFSHVSNGSKMAMSRLCRDLVVDGFGLLDCQMYTEHLASLGARAISRASFCQQMARDCSALKKWRPPQHL
ncbi:MAG: leucyl/phenylalanyl-tRNA--protein transferase [Pseudomonadota bacterium]